MQHFQKTIVVKHTQKLLSAGLFIILLIVSACGGAAPAEAPAPAPEAASKAEFELKFKTVDQKRLASAEVDLTGLAPAPADQTYVLWLMTDGDKNIQAGSAEAGETFVYRDPADENLVGKTTGAALSLETATGVESLAAPTNILYAGHIPAEIIPLARVMVVTAPDTPNGMPYDPGLKQQAILAAEHGQLALDAIGSGDLKTAQQHTEHVLNIVNGAQSPAFGDLNGDGQTQNPGDGYGAWVYAGKVAEFADQAAETPNLGNPIREAAVAMGACARKISNEWGPQTDEQAQAILAAADAAAAKPAVESLAQVLNQIAEGVDANGNGTVELVQAECGANQIYQLSHALFDIRLAAGQKTAQK